MLKRKISILNILFYISILLIYTSIIFQGISGYSTYNLNEPLNLADNFFRSGIFQYPDLIESYNGTTTYFPGSAFIAILAVFINKNNSIILLQLFSGFNILIFIYSIISVIKLDYKITKIIYIIIPFIFFTLYKETIWYAYDFKIDILLISIFNFLLVLEHNKNKNIIDNILIIFLIIIGFILKQQFLYLFIIYLITFFRNFSYSKLFIYFLIVFVTYLFLFSIKNLYFFTIYLHKEKAFQDFLHIGNLVLNFVEDKWLLTIFIIFSILHKKSYYLFFWLILSFASAFKVGGTVENFSNGLLIFLPIIILTILQFINSHSLILKIKITLTIFATIYFSLILVKSIIFFKQTQYNLNYAKNYISNLDRGNILFDASSYSILRNSKHNLISSYTTILNLSEIKYNLQNYKNDLISNKYTYLIFDNTQISNKIIYFDEVLIKKYLLIKTLIINKEHTVYIYKIVSN